MSEIGVCSTAYSSLGDLMDRAALRIELAAAARLAAPVAASQLGIMLMGVVDT